MAIISCPECGKGISDKADACIHCGYPLRRYRENEAAGEPEARAKEVPAENAGTGGGPGRPERRNLPCGKTGKRIRKGGRDQSRPPEDL